MPESRFGRRGRAGGLAAARVSLALSLSALVSLALVLGACSPSVPTVTEVAPPPVATSPVVLLDLEDHIEATGELEARFHTIVAAEVSGHVTTILVDEGAPVEAQTAVLEIDPCQRELEVERALAGVAQAEASLNKERRQATRVRELDRSSVASKARLDEAELALRVAESNLAAQRAQLGLARQALEKATVRAPFAGVLGERKVNLGEFVQPGKPLAEFVSLDPIEVVFHLSEVDSGRVLTGQRVEVRVAPHPGEAFEATVSVIYPTIDPQTRTLRVKATLANPDGRLRPGLFARADLGVALRKGVTMVPEEAVLQRTDGAVIFLLRGEGRVERRVVELGVFREGLVEVKGESKGVMGGLQADDVVVTRGHADLIDGAVVRLEAQPAGASAPVACGSDGTQGGSDETAPCDREADRVAGGWVRQP
ncbi:MAG: efflux RND transporter periplasmic adaptor subunit [Deltaproteobacteria bacterium]|nr:efflux RND transporter periplasmic adaptor subunit [Deltaproteobacteria bacterium]MBW2419571.1 efflux RND transporter periplasmic adaptor subunit [Deltaproteobacteria bacterium]